jgi:hypothetical protein
MASMLGRSTLPNRRYLLARDGTYGSIGSGCGSILDLWTLYDDNDPDGMVAEARAGAVGAEEL